MSFFGAAFASLTLYSQGHLSGAAPFVAFVVIGLAASYVIRPPGGGIDLRRPDLLMPAMTLAVGVHFLPIAFAAGLRPFHLLGIASVAAASAGFIAGAPMGGDVAGFMAAGALCLAAAMAIRRDLLARRRAATGV